MAAIARVLAENQSLMAKEDHLSARVEKVYRAWKEEERLARQRAKDKVVAKQESKVCMSAWPGFVCVCVGGGGWGHDGLWSRCTHSSILAHGSL